jgi:hypothetical protein
MSGPCIPALNLFTQKIGYVPEDIHEHVFRQHAGIGVVA